MAVPLLYLAGIAEGALIALMHGVAGVHADVVSFPEGGGSTDLELAIPQVPGMDEVVVDVAQLRVLAETPELELSTYQVSDVAGGGSLLDLGAECRLRRVVVDAPSTATAMAADVHTVVRAAPGRVPGPPVFAHPPFDSGSTMYGPVLGGLSVSTVGEGRQLSFPGTQGSAWLLQYATGTGATNLEPRPDRFAVRRVTVAAAATDVSLVIPGPSPEDPGIMLWHHPGAFLPEAGEQEVNFTPLAQKQLNAALTGATASPTLPIPLRLSATSGGAVRVVSRTLVTRYLVRPLGPEPVTVRVGGDWTPLALSTPAARRPGGSTLRLRARHLGRELNGTRMPPLDLPRAGVRVGAGRLVAAAVPVAAVTPAAVPVAGPVPLTGVRVLVAAEAGVEAVLELRADAAGAPGMLIAAPVVRQVAPATAPAWLDFELPAPVRVAAGGTVWAALRTNRGELHWYADPVAGGGEARASVDSGASWGTVDDGLADAGRPLVQLFHSVPVPSGPVVELFLAGGPAGAVTLSPVADGAWEFQATESALPAPVLAALAATPGASGDRASTQLLLFCRAVADLTVEELTLSYDPFAPPGG